MPPSKNDLEIEVERLTVALTTTTADLSVARTQIDTLQALIAAAEASAGQSLAMVEIGAEERSGREYAVYSEAIEKIRDAYFTASDGMATIIVTIAQRRPATIQS